MAEEEAGFTFVDKRRTSVETPAETPMPAEPEPSQAEANDAVIIDSTNIDATDINGDDDDRDVGALPSTYDLLGYCINLLSSQAWQKLGLLADPQTGEAKPDLVEAKIAIDAVSDLAARLETAPESAIPADMRRGLRTLVNDLRLNYVSQRGTSAS